MFSQGGISGLHPVSLRAAGTVTGSKHLINTGDPSGKNGIQILVDCGIFQGPKE
jgi:hypothetical protein